MRSIVYGPKWPFYSYCEYIGLFGTGICRYCIWVELPVQRRLCPIFVKSVGSPDIHEYSVGLRVVNGPPGLGRHNTYYKIGERKAAIINYKETQLFNSQNLILLSAKSTLY